MQMVRGDASKAVATDAVEASEELVAVAKRWIKAIETKDSDVLSALFSNSNSLRYIGSDQEEIFHGQILREGYAHHIDEVPDFRAECHSVEAFQSGRIGWAIWLGEFHFIESDERFPWRFSLILNLESGIWKIVHAHTSTPRSNVEIVGHEHAVFQRLMEAAKAEGEVFGVEGTATIMFTDVANSATLAAYVGDRAWTKVIGRHFDDVGAIIERHEGVVVKTLGDGTMSSFVSARAAMQAAAGIQQNLLNDNEEPALQVRIGMHTGDVVQTDGDFFGSVVNKAARIAAIAEPASILVSETTRAMAEGSPNFCFEESRPVALKGIEGEHQVSRLLLADGNA
jgi:class 3 adenylate cyclase